MAPNKLEDNTEEDKPIKVAGTESVKGSDDDLFPFTKEHTDMMEAYVQRVTNRISEKQKELEEQKKVEQQKQQDQLRKLKRSSEVPQEKEFNTSIEEILEAIAKDGVIEGVRIAEEVQNPLFRFTIIDDPLGAKLSKAFAATASRALESTSKIVSEKAKEAAAKSNEKQGKRADEYARTMYDVVQKIKAEKGDDLSLRETAQILMDRGYKTPRDNTNWFAGTLQTLEKRWEKLGLTPPTAEPK